MYICLYLIRKFFTENSEKINAATGNRKVMLYNYRSVDFAMTLCDL
jgi:hypothetical protein